MSNYDVRCGMGGVLYGNETLIYGGLTTGAVILGDCGIRELHEDAHVGQSWTLTKTNNTSNPGRLYHPAISTLIDTAASPPISKVWLFGGFNGSTFSDKICRSTDNGATWTTVTTFASAREVKSINFNGKIHLCGGSIGGVAMKEHKTWDGTALASLSAMPTEVKDHSLVYFRGAIYSLGGRDTSESVVADTYKYTTAGGWEAFEILPSGMCNAAATGFKGRIWIFGGHDNSTVINKVYCHTDTIGWSNETKNVTMTYLDGTTSPFPYLSDACIINTGMQLLLHGGVDREGNLYNNTYYSEDGFNWFEIDTTTSYNLYRPIIYSVRNSGTNEKKGHVNELIQIRGLNLRSYVAKEFYNNSVFNGSFISDISGWTKVESGGTTGSISHITGGGMLVTTTTNAGTNPSTLIVYSDICRADGEKNYRICIELSDATTNQNIDVHLYTGVSPASYIKQRIVTNQSGGKQWYISDIMSVPTTEQDIRVAVGLAGLAGTSLIVYRIVLLEA